MSTAYFFYFYNLSTTQLYYYYSTLFVDVKKRPIDEKTTLMRRLLGLFVGNPVSRGEFLDKNWQFYIVAERVGK